jgi:hypothetical protein
MAGPGHLRGLARIWDRTKCLNYESILPMLGRIDSYYPHVALGRDGFSLSPLRVFPFLIDP